MHDGFPTDSLMGGSGGKKTLVFRGKFGLTAIVEPFCQEVIQEFSVNLRLALNGSLQRKRSVYLQASEILMSLLRRISASL